MAQRPTRIQRPPLRITAHPSPARPQAAAVFGGESGADCAACAFDPADSQALAGLHGRVLQLRDLRQAPGRPAVQRAHPSRALCVAFSAGQAGVLATGGDDGRVRLWDLRCGRPAVGGP